MIRRLLPLLTMAAALLMAPGPAQAGPKVVDLTGRTITVPDKVERVILGEGRAVIALAILDRAEPLARVVGTMGDFPLLDPIGHAKWLKRFPRLGEINAIGKVAADSFSVERSIALKPDLALFSMAGHGPAPKDVEIVKQFGGRNLASGLIPGYAGTISLEYLMTHQPDIYLGTAVGNIDTAAKAPERIVLGHDTPAELARSSFARALARPGIGRLQAVRQGRAYALWHHFVHSPFNVVAVQVLAQWLHPTHFADLDPAATLRELTTRFQPLPLDGVFWTQYP